MSLFTRIGELRSAVSGAASDWARDIESVGMVRTSSGRKVSRRNSIQMIAVYACQSLIGDAVASLPVDHYTKINGQKETFDPVRSPRWIRQPNPFQTSYEFWFRVIISLLTDGNAFIYTLRNDRGEVAALYCLHPQYVSILDGPLGDNRFEVSDDQGAVQGVLDRSQLLHIPAFTVPGASRGLSPIDVAREAIGLGLVAEEFGSRFFEQGTTMAGVIEHPGSPRPDEARLLRDMFRKTHAGVKNSHSVGVLTGGASFKPITLSPEQAQFLETRRFQKTEIALLYRVPAYLVDSSVSSTWGTGIEEQNKFFVDQTLMPWIVRIEQAVSTFLLPGLQYIRFNVDARLRAKTKDRYEAYQVALNNGFLNADEIRAMEDLPPLPKKLGQKFYRPLNLGVVGDDGKEEKKAEAGQTPPALPVPPVVPDPNADPNANQDPNATDQKDQQNADGA
ncbi:phage portal protein [Streptomyces cucumeris]|uniref:phage portal protein n=1 Tax=Streptomyces cucumeris TaxID=2962890 RepID=UPI0020C86F72|nr:phage portal protein [Streptomyces sp. NEAU-Y11]MCP9207814.1 phage portal protein [Streptomyces sp. NEAU-Y11]